MAGINPISGANPVAGHPGISGAQTQRGTVTQGKFADALQDYVGKVDQDQRVAGAAIEDLVSGKTDSILPVVSAVANADMSFKLLVGVRNKVIEAYKQTMNMQV